MNAVTARNATSSKMSVIEFELNIQFAQKIGGDYFIGYKRGLSRRFYGDNFGTDELHSKWMRIGIEDNYRPELGIGYRDGFAGKPPMYVYHETTPQDVR